VADLHALTRQERTEPESPGLVSRRGFSAAV